jgi:hypothetical protein
MVTVWYDYLPHRKRVLGNPTHRQERYFSLINAPKWGKNNDDSCLEYVDYEPKENMSG